MKALIIASYAASVFAMLTQARVAETKAEKDGYTIAASLMLLGALMVIGK